MRALEKFASNFLPLGYPIETDPICIAVIDNFAINGDKVFVINKISKESDKSEYTIVKNTTIDDILSRLNSFFLNNQSEITNIIICDDTWARSNQIGYLMEFGSLTHIIDIKILNLSEQEIEIITQWYEDIKKEKYI